MKRLILRHFGPDGSMVFTLIGINILISLILWIYAAIAWACHLDSGLILDYLSLSGSLHKLLKMPWTPVSYMFTQISPLHLLFNLLWLFWFGKTLSFLSSPRLLLLYAGGGLFGATGFLWAVNSPDSYLCGASASVLAIITYCAIISPDTHISFFAVGAVRLRWVVFGALALTFFGAGLHSGSLAAHSGGVIFGIIMALITKYSPKTSVIKKERKRRVPGVIPQRIPHRRQGEELKLSDSERLDELLDKIRISGFASLSSDEKHELNAISQRLREADENTEKKR